MEPETTGIIKPSTPDSAVTITVKRRSVDMYSVFESELDTIGSASIQGSLHTAFFGATFGAAVSLWVTIFTVEIVNPRTNSIFWATAFVCSIFSVYFFVRSIIDWREASSKVEQIKKADPGRELS